MIMMNTMIQLKHGITALKVVTRHQASRFELSQHTVNRRQTDIFIALDQRFINILSAHVLIFIGLQNL